MSLSSDLTRPGALSDVTSKLIAYESGELDTEGTLDLFAELIRSGAAWSLQGSYGRQAQSFIDAGLITAEGEITQHGKSFL